MAEVRRQVWRENFQKFLLFRNISDQESRTNVNVVLDQLNAEEYKENFVDYASTEFTDGLKKCWPDGFISVQAGTLSCNGAILYYFLSNTRQFYLSMECVVQLNDSLIAISIGILKQNIIDIGQDITKLINKGCILIPVNKTNSFLLSKFFQLVGRLLVKHKVVFDEETLEKILQHVITSSRSLPTISVYDNLKLLGELLFENGVKCKRFYQDLLCVKPKGLLLQYCSNQSLDIETQKAAIISIGNLCQKDSNGSFIPESYGEVCLLAILNIMQTPPRKDVIKIDHCKFINVCLKAMQDIFPCVKSCLKLHLGQLLLTIKNYIFYGFPNYELPFVNMFTSESSSPRDSSSDMEPDDLSLLKVSLNPVKERAFPARGALKKKSRQKRGKRHKNDKNNDQFDKHTNCTSTNSRVSRIPEHSRNSNANRDSREERDTPHIVPDTSIVQSWRDRSAKQNWRLDDSMNTQYPTSSSESEFSDSETGQVRRLRSATARVRNTSLICLQTVIKNSDRKDLFGFWSSFISDGSGALSSSLFTIIQNDMNIKNRIGAISVLMDLIDCSKPFLAAANDSDQGQKSSSRPFTPFSSRLGSMIHELHRLLDFIPTESSTTVQCQLVKCLAILVLNCPYNKLQTGLLSKIVQTIRQLLKETDMALKQSCFVCLSAVLTINAPLTEVIETMQESRVFPVQTVSFHSTELSSPSGECSRPLDQCSRLSSECSRPSVRVSASSDSECSIPWLISECFNILQNPNTKSNKDLVSDDAVSTLRSEVLLLFIVFVRNYFNLLRPVVPQISQITRECLKDTNLTIKVNAIKVLQELGRVMYQILSVNKDDGLKIVIYEFWSKLLEGDIVKILQSRDALENKIKSAACDCLSDIGAGVFEELRFDKRILILTIFLGLVNDEDSYVRAASVRALGVYVLYPILREDTVFFTDTANAALNGLNDSVLLVRMRAAWSLANLSDALVINKNTKDSMFVLEFSENLLLRIINASLKASDDSEKVRCNIVRTLGNLAKYLSEENIEKRTFLAAVENIFEVLTKCILNGQMKTRWNACYAAGNVYTNSCLPHGQTSASLKMLHALLSVVNSCKNFKVRINAVNALAVPASRDCYGDEEEFKNIWCCLTETLSATESISDFSEFKYRDNLREQICSTICHITSLIDGEDLRNINTILEVNQDDLTQHLTNFYQKQLKEKRESCMKKDEETSPAPSKQPFLIAYEHVMAMSEESGIIQNIYTKAKNCAENSLQEEIDI